MSHASSFVDIAWAERRVRIEHQWVGVAGRAAPLIVFLHEGLGSLAMWRDFPQQLCEAAACRGLVYSRPGYGRSTPRATVEAWGLDFMHRQAHEVLPVLLDALDVDTETHPPWLFGHSDGASIALLYASKFVPHLAGAVLLAPHILVENLSVSSIEKTRSAYLETDLRERLAKYHDDPDSAFWGWNRIWLHPPFKQWSIESEIESIRCPLLAVQGLQDEYGTLEQIRGIARRVPHAQLLELPDCGHSPHRDQPEKVIATAAEFIRRHLHHSSKGTPMLSYRVESFGKPLAQVLHDTPQPQGSEVIVKVGSCGVCHSDVHLHDGYFDLGGGNKLDMTRSLQPPRTLGHEIAGTVVAMGPEAKGVAVGDRRVVFPWIGCGQCALCAAGNEHLCNTPRALGVHRDGGFADHVLVPHPKYLLEFDPLPEDQACTYACSGLTAFSALKKAAPLGPKDLLLIVGAGGVGLSGIRLARELYPQATLIVAELDKGKWDIAREAGAHEVIDPTAEGAAKALVKASGGGVAAAIDFVGAAATFSFAFGVLRKAGKLVCVGLFGGTTPIVPAMVSMKAVSVIGSYVGSLAEMHELLAIARQGKLPGLPLTTRPLSDATQALEDLRAGRVRGRIILHP